VAPLIRATVCTANPHKLQEFRDLCPGWELDALDASDYPPEDGVTFLDNARIKARYGRISGPPDRWMLANDSGIEIDALGGGPGVPTASPPSGAIATSSQTYCARRSSTPSSAASIFSTCRPSAQRAVTTPGAPSSAATSIPESSASIQRSAGPTARPKRALLRALSTYVAPCSGGRGVYRGA